MHSKEEMCPDLIHTLKWNLPIGCCYVYSGTINHNTTHVHMYRKHIQNAWNQLTILIGYTKFESMADVIIIPTYTK